MPPACGMTIRAVPVHGRDKFLGAFQKASAKQPVNLQPCIDNLPRGFLSALVNRLVIFVCFVVHAFATTCK